MTNTLTEKLRQHVTGAIERGEAVAIVEQPALLECGHPPTPQAPGACGTGYGQDRDGKRYCYECCADRDAADMVATGRAVLYLSRHAARGWEITNWPGSLRFPVGTLKRSPRGGGGFGAERMDAWFIGPDGKRWHAINRGDMQLARCRRLKS